MDLVIPTIVKPTIVRPTIVRPTIVNNMVTSLNPKVYFSLVTLLNINAIIITFNKAMEITCDIADHINVVIDGAAPIHPISVKFITGSTDKVELLMAIPFLSGQIITWSYDNSGACNLQEIIIPNTEIDILNHKVTNKLSSSAFSDDFSSAFH